MIDTKLDYNWLSRYTKFFAKNLFAAPDGAIVAHTDIPGGKAFYDPEKDKGYLRLIARAVKEMILNSKKFKLIEDEKEVTGKLNIPGKKPMTIITHESYRELTELTLIKKKLSDIHNKTEVMVQRTESLTQAKPNRDPFGPEKFATFTIEEAWILYYHLMNYKSKDKSAIKLFDEKAVNDLIGHPLNIMEHELVELKKEEVAKIHSRYQEAYTSIDNEQTALINEAVTKIKSKFAKKFGKLKKEYDRNLKKLDKQFHHSIRNYYL